MLPWLTKTNQATHFDLFMSLKRAKQFNDEISSARSVDDDDNDDDDVDSDDNNDNDDDDSDDEDDNNIDDCQPIRASESIYRSMFGH